MSPLLAGFAGILAFASAWELAGVGGLPLPGRLRRRFAAPALRPARLAGALAGIIAFAICAPVVPGKLEPLLAAGLVLAGWLGPDALAERRARRRRRRLAAALPDALDLLAVGAAAGRAPSVLLAEIGRGASGPLAEEFATTVAEIEIGVPQERAFARLRARSGAPELGALAAAVERSRCYGSPLGEQLHSQAAALRRAERRRIAEDAARAAPKIQLVIALVLVPSALLAIAAALVAHSDAFFGAL